MNREQLQYNSSVPGNRAAVQATLGYSFGNATTGGRLLFRDGTMSCLNGSDVMLHVTDELLIVTLRDSGEEWYGAFMGDYTLLDPQYAPDGKLSEGEAYTTIGWLRRTAARGLETLSVQVIPSMRRFVPITARINLSQDASRLNLNAAFVLPGGITYTVRVEADPALGPSSGKAGILYLANNGYPCTNILQREIVVDSFRLSAGS